MENKEYLETTFPDGTPVKIYPMKNKDIQYDEWADWKDKAQEEIESDAIETMLALADKSPVIEHGAVNALYYKDLIVLSGQYSNATLADLKATYPQIKHIITISNKSFNRWNKSTQ